MNYIIKFSQYYIINKTNNFTENRRNLSIKSNGLDKIVLLIDILSEENEKLNVHLTHKPIGPGADKTNTLYGFLRTHRDILSTVIDDLKQIRVIFEHSFTENDFNCE